MRKGTQADILGTKFGQASLVKFLALRQGLSTTDQDHLDDIYQELADFVGVDVDARMDNWTVTKIYSPMELMDTAIDEAVGLLQLTIKEVKHQEIDRAN